MQFNVLREHHGERFFRAGETRQADPADVAHLLDRGVLAVAEGKSAPASKSKPAPAVQNKAQPAGRNKVAK